jgi:hypothetical protein
MVTPASMETAHPPVPTITDLAGGVTDLDGCSSPARPDIAGGGMSASHTATVDSLKVLDPERPIRELDVLPTAMPVRRAQLMSAF